MSAGMFAFLTSILYEGIDRGATPETVKKAFEILIADKKVKSIFINIFGGMSKLLGQKR